MNDDYIASGRQAQKQKTRQAILESAQKLIENGKDFSLEDVAKKAQISRATIYRYYSNVEVLTIEAGLDINTLSPQKVLEQSESDELIETILNIQDYYNQLGIDNEVTFRKYLSVMLNPSLPATERGARRVKTLSLAFHNKLNHLSSKEKDYLIYTATTLMGMEALIVTKDVCGLDNVKAKETLRWGLRKVLESVLG